MAPGSSPVRLGCALLLVLVMLCSPLLAQMGGPGSVYELFVSNPDVQDAAAFAIDAYNRDSNNRFYYKVLRVLKAEMQVVGSLMFFLKAELVKTKCKKKGKSGLNLSDLKRCAVPPKAKQKKLLCEFQVLYRPGPDKIELPRTKCQPSRS